MNLFKILLLLFSVASHVSIAQILVNQEAAALNKRRIQRQKQGRSLRRLERFKRKNGVGGFVRHMPNTIIKDANLKENEGYLVNKLGQKLPIFFTEEESNSKKLSASNFYLGHFYDLDDRRIRHAYLKSPSA